MDKELSKFYMFPGQQIGWSAQERANVRSKMYAYMQTYGPANWFITVSPLMADNWLTQKLMQRQTHDMTDDGRDANEWKPNEAPSLKPRCTHFGDTRRHSPLRVQQSWQSKHALVTKHGTDVSISSLLVCVSTRVEFLLPGPASADTPSTLYF